MEARKEGILMTFPVLLEGITDNIMIPSKMSLLFCILFMKCVNKPMLQCKSSAPNKHVLCFSILQLEIQFYIALTMCIKECIAAELRLSFLSQLIECRRVHGSQVSNPRY